MIIYCAGPIKGDITYQKFYWEIVNFVEAEGHTPLTGLFSEASSTNKLTDAQIYKRDIKWIEGSKLLIAEISGASLGVGFEISYALFQKKIPVLALFNNSAEKISAMITGCDSNLLTIAKYSSEEELREVIRTYITKPNT